MKFETAPGSGFGWHSFMTGDAFALILVLALLLVAVAFTLLRRRARSRRACRWKKDTRRRAGSERWQCMACGVDAFTRSGRPPRECKRLLRETRL